MNVLRAVLAVLLLPSALFAAGHDLSPSPLSANQLRPVVTGNGSGFMAAWIEYMLPPGHYTIASQAVSANGELLEGGNAASDQAAVYSLAIAHSPSDALVVWNDVNGNLFADRVAPSGVRMSPTLVTFAKNNVSDIAVAWNGSRYFVVWTTAAQLLGAFIEADGSATAPRAFFSEPSLNGFGPEEIAIAPQVAWNGQHFIVVFAELPNRPCPMLCPTPYPDQFRLMRVSGDGDAIDSSPLVISGTHVRAHVASSGAESLIALDGISQASTIVVHDDQRGLTLDAEVPLAQWFSGIWSNVVWDGTTYTAGWRYMGGDASWIGAARVTRSGLPFDYRFVATSTPRSWWAPPSMAANDAGVTGFAISEGAGQFDRARLYLASELAPLPAPPPAPVNVVSYFGGMTARIDWQSGPADGFVIEWSTDFGKHWGVIKTVPASARTTTVYAAVGNQFRVRAFGPGGTSDGTVTSIGSMFRHRAARP